jgi:hypothetical protein
VGRAVPEDARVHRRLEQQLRAKGIEAEVINAGVQGYSTDQELLLMERLGALYHPDIVILAVCANDFLQNSADSAYGLKKPRYVPDGKGGLQYVAPAPQEAIARFGSGPSAWVQYSALYRALQPAIVRMRATLGNWRERNVLGLADQFYYLPEAINGVDWELFAQLIVRMQRASDALGAQFFVYLHPAIDEVWEPYIVDSIRRAGIAPDRYDRYAVEGRIAGIANRNGIRFVPQIDRFLAHSGQGPFHLLPRDPHCNERCYLLTAEILAEAIGGDKGAPGFASPQSIGRR